MSAKAEDFNAEFYYYDADYPSQLLSAYPENFDEVTRFQGIALDVGRYQEIARGTGGPILELCCGTGRIAIPLARDGHSVTGVDLSQQMLDQLTAHLNRQEPAVAARIKIIKQDITQMSLPEKEFKLIICAFNSLLLILDFEAQMRVIELAGRHLAPGGTLVLDVVNPHALKIEGDPAPKPFFTRRNPHNGNVYTRFATMGPFDANHRQRLYGWYDELDSEGIVKRHPYSRYWRPIGRFELELMVRRANLRVESLEGGHLKESYSAQGSRMFVQIKHP